MSLISGLRDSSGSEVTLGDESMSGYFEPFGKALPPAPSAHEEGRREKCRDSIACSETDLELVMGAVGQKRQQMQQLAACNMHHAKGLLQQQHQQQQYQQQQHHQQQQKQLKGILKKESSFSKPTTTASLTSITTNPTANVIVISSDRESTASGSPPPLSDPINLVHVSNISSKAKLQQPPKVLPKPAKNNKNQVVSNPGNGSGSSSKNVNVLSVWEWRPTYLGRCIGRR